MNAQAVSEAFLTGCSDTAHAPLVSRDSQRLLPEVWEAFDHLVAAAAVAGFDLRAASTHRSFARQLAIFNGKACGERPTLDDSDCPVAMAELPVPARIEAILRFSALPGASRHHWGTELDVYDAAAMPGDYRLALTASEVAPGGMFDSLHCWLDERIAAGESYGFYRPYDCDRGGVAPERWHLSYAPLATDFAAAVDADCLRRCWARPEASALYFRETLLEELPALVERYLRRVAPPPF